MMIKKRKNEKGQVLVCVCQVSSLTRKKKTKQRACKKSVKNCLRKKKKLRYFLWNLRIKVLISVTLKAFQNEMIY